ncbi:MAG: hypothetical protein IJT44_12410 [Clostridia bacterium]|nr:hypothetical protein [Clostridia bacterium]
MKKLLGLVLCSALLVGAASIGRTAAAPVLEKESYPVILMPGILENALVRDKGTPKQKIIWFPMDRFLGAFLQHGPAILSCLARGDLDDIRKVGATVVTQIAEPIRIDPDGTSHYNISTLVSEAKECSYNALKKRGMLRRVTYGPMMLKEAAARVGGERAFVFQYDWRMSAVDIAKDLHSFIQDVKALTGSDKVCISGTSYGCNVLLCYLDAYGGENDLHSVLMNSPAYGGTEIFREMLGSDEPLHINYEGLFNMFLGNYGVEAELGYLLKLMPKGSIDVIFEGSLEKFIKPYFLSSIALWGVCPPADYEEMKALLLDPAENAEMIRKTDAMQNVMARAGEILRRAQASGVRVSAIVNEGCPLITSLGSGDVLVDAGHGSGGVCLPIGEHFDESYRPARTVCVDPTHDHVSYTGSLDLTNAYLPENTWVFYGQMHGQNYWDTRARALSLALLTTDDVTDVYSDPAFPQFCETAMAVSDVSLTLKGSPQSVLHPTDGAVAAVLENHSRKHAVRIRAIRADGVPYTFSDTQLLLLPGQSREITLTPTGKPSARYGSVTLEYDELPNLKLHKSRTQYFEIR